MAEVHSGGGTNRDTRAFAGRCVHGGGGTPSPSAGTETPTTVGAGRTVGCTSRHSSCRGSTKPMVMPVPYRSRWWRGCSRESWCVLFTLVHNKQNNYAYKQLIRMFIQVIGMSPEPYGPSTWCVLEMTELSRLRRTGTRLCCSANAARLSTQASTAGMGELSSDTDLGLSKVAQRPFPGVVKEVLQPE